MAILMNSKMLLSPRFAATLVCLCLAAPLSLLAQENPHGTQDSDEPDITEADPQAAAAREAELLSRTRQLTFEGRRAGEGYFSRDGSQMVFQSEREAGNPFFQIYLLDLETGDVQRVSPGVGKTTCAWIHPDGDRVLFASTHEDKEAEAKQKEEIDLRNSGNQRRYAWDYDETFDIYDFESDTDEYVNLTNKRGYDAEASWSPDGKLIAFTSNRQAYDGELSEEDRKQFEIDPAYLNEIYLMNADGTDVRRLTEEPGYDGGPFFSPDGQRICWRRFTPDGAIAEVWTMNVDGSDQRQLTRLGAMSWAPFYHPSGEYLIFTTNRHGFANFELYLIDVEGKSQPVRVTYTTERFRRSPGLYARWKGTGVDVEPHKLEAVTDIHCGLGPRTGPRACSVSTAGPRVGVLPSWRLMQRHVRRPRRLASRPAAVSSLRM